MNLFCLVMICVSIPSYCQELPCWGVFNGDLYKVSCKSGDKIRWSTQSNVEDFDYNDKYLFVVKRGELSRLNRETGQSLQGASYNMIAQKVKKIKIYGDVLQVTHENGDTKRIKLN